jgi:hypothetical protein
MQRKTKHMFVSCLQATGQNGYIKVTNKAFENVAKFKYLGMTVTNQNCINEEQIKFRECSLPRSSEYFVFPTAN